MNKTELLEMALEKLTAASNYIDTLGGVSKGYRMDIERLKAALEANDEPVGLIESLKDAQPCCGQYETCWRACTPRGKFIGQRDAQRKPLTDEEIQDALEAEFLGCDKKRNWQDDLRVARAIEASHGIKGEA